MDSKTREPIIGASITVEGEKTGAISDIDGRFEIEAPGSIRSFAFLIWAMPRNWFR